MLMFISINVTELTKTEVEASSSLATCKMCSYLTAIATCTCPLTKVDFYPVLQYL